MPDRQSLVVRAAALLTLHILGLVAGFAAIVFLRAYGEALGVGGIELTLAATLGLQVFRLIPAVHRAGQSGRVDVPYALQVAVVVFLTGASLCFYARGGLPSVAGFGVSLFFWTSWLVVLKGLIPLKAAHDALKRAKPSQRGALSA